MRRHWILTTAAFAVLLAACSSSGSTYSVAGGGAPSPAGPNGTTVKVADSDLGSILVDGQGRTLYLFEQDRGTDSTCYDLCAQGWPPLLSDGVPSGGGGLDASLLATSPRTDGTTQVTYDGHPLYYFVSDAQPGDTLGQAVDAFGALWYVLGTDGSAILGSA